MNDLQRLIENEGFEAARNEILINKWEKNINAVRSVDSNFSLYEQIGLANLLENLGRELNRALNEITEPTAIGPFKRYAFQ